MSIEAPTVSVVIATYNRSEVLRYAVASVLAQSFGDLEVLVIGDGCTDDSEAVVRSFVDPRLRWDNLPENSGNQSAPNNRGIALARGRYIAYLGHDDLWHPSHLGTLVAGIERTGAAFVHSLLMFIGPPPDNHRKVLGLSPDGRFAARTLVPPSAWLHDRALTERIGAWRDYRSIVLPPDFEFLMRTHQRQTRMAAINRLSVFKFPSALRKNSYVERSSHEQAAWAARMANEPDFLANELTAAMVDLARDQPAVVAKGDVPGNALPGTLTESMRRARGLSPTREPGPAIEPIYSDRDLLQFVNRDADIGPPDDRACLAAGGDLPEDGLFVGMNWHGLETGDGDRSWRWMERDAQVVVTRPSGLRRRLAIDLLPGPGLVARRPLLQVRNAAGAVVHQTVVRGPGAVVVDLPLEKSPGAVFSLGTEDGGRVVAPDQRVLNFRIFRFGWA